MQSSRGAFIGKFCCYLAYELKGLKFLACCVLPDWTFCGNCFYWWKCVRDFDDATQCFKKRRFRIVWSDSLNLPVLSLLCAWARRLKTRTQRSQAICTSMLSASKTPVNQKSYHLNALHLYPAQTRKQTKKELPNSYIKRLNYRHPFNFYKKRGLGPDHSHHNRSRLWSRLHTALAQITRIALKWIYTVSKIFSQFTIFALALKKQSCLENFRCIEYTFYIQDF